MTSGGVAEIDNLLVLINKAKEILTQRGLKDLKLPPEETVLKSWIERLEQQQFHANQRFTIMILGEYNAGKSTLLNALLKLPKEKRLPVGYEPTTAKPIRLSYRKDGDPEAFWLLTNGQRQVKSWQDTLRVADQTVSVEDRDSTQEIQVFLDLPLLYQADILDMPGTGTAEFEVHTKLTRDYMDNVEMIIWVIGAVEPGKEGRRDFNKAKETGAPITVVFNAWGTLDEEINREMELEDQDEYEESVRKHFREAFSHSADFRIYGQKCLDALDQDLAIPEEFGLDGFYNYLYNNYTGEFINRRHNGRLRALYQTSRIAANAFEVLEKARESWNYQLSHLGSEGEQIKDERRQVYSLERQIQGRILKLANTRAQIILDYMEKQISLFLEDTITPRNFGLFRAAFSSQEELKQELNTKLEKEYLHLYQPNNWLEQQVADFLRDAGVILDAEWNRFLDEVDLVSPQGAGREVGQVINLPFDRIQQSALATVHEMVATVLISTAAMGILISIPVVQLLAIAVMVLSPIFFNERITTHREKAILNVRNEMAIQRSGVVNSLLQIIMTGPHAKLKQSFEQIIAQRSATLSAQVQLIETGLDIINELQQAFEAIERRPQ